MGVGPGHACHVTCPQPVARSHPQVDLEELYQAPDAQLA